MKYINSEVDIENYNLIRMDHSRKEGRVACCIRRSLSYNCNSSFCPNIKNIFVDIFLLKLKPILVGVLDQQPDKPEFIDYLGAKIILSALAAR